MAPPRTHPGRQRQRRDIEGLRAVAVAAVVLYHAHVGWVSGGYVGVDVFFVISGFLITGLLWRELEDKGHISLVNFYGRRIRRLIPAAMVVLGVTMAVSVVVLPPLQLESVWKDGLACVLYLGNYRFVLAQTNYLTSSAPPSPFQHYWSLGVEEQFYLLWPVLLLGTAWLARRHSRRLAATVTLSGVAAGSFIASLILTRTDEPWAFFSLPTRAWELAIGGVMALAGPTLGRLPAWIASTAGWIGLSAIVASVLIFNSFTAFPGWAALVPVAGTALVLGSGIRDHPSGPVIILGRRVPRFLGRISYSLYLWHWPVLILTPSIVGHSLNEAENLGLVAVSIVLATATFSLIERPFRDWRWLAGPSRRSLTFGGVLTATGVAVCLIAFASIPSTAGHGLAPVATLKPPPRVSAGDRRPAGASPPTTIDPAAATFHSEQSQEEAAVAASATLNTVPANLSPALASAAGSEAAPSVDGCLLSFLDDVSPTCLFGDTTGTSSIVLVGDSHAAMWYSAVDTYALAENARLYVWTKATCPPDAEPFFSPALGRAYTECADWLTNTVTRIQALRPSLVVFGIAPNYDSAYDITQDSPSWLAGLTTTINQVAQSGARVAVIGPVPSPPTTVPDCLSANLTTASNCDVPTQAPRAQGGGLVGYDLPGQAAEERAVEHAGATFLNVEPWFCTATTCPVIIDNLLVFRDNSHVTVPFATYLAPLIDYELDQKN